ncbi:hypothetical protein ES695_01465 [Candidatus Atribacteria bacterium 1244-E10-H5-B2]|nr:MAG: hypothetical protein ES695_01465 [Candidatus Atribacteria bacterium 1244-E10-H5-B2]
MVESINISIGGVVVKRLSDYIHREDKSETYQRTINRKLIINRSVNVEDQPITKYYFEIPGVEDDELDNIRIVALKISDLYLIDYYKIFEVLSGDGDTDTWTLQRILADQDYIPEIIVDDVVQTVVVTSATDPGEGFVYVNKDTGVMTFGTTPSDLPDNIKIKYTPKYLVHIISWDRTYIYNGLLTYILICEEV